MSLTDWHHDVAFLEGVLESFALLNEKNSGSFHFSVSSIDSTDLDELLTALYGSQYVAADLADPSKTIATAFDRWLYRFITDSETRLADGENAFHTSDPVVRSAFSAGLAGNIMTTVSPSKAVEVFPEANATDEEECVEFALVGSDKILLIHLGRLAP